MTAAVVDRREKKRLATLKALATAAIELTLERGPENVTVDQIAERADVSSRTFFNYFSSKEEAIVGVSRDWIESAATSLRARPADEPPVASLAVVLSKGADDPDEAARRWEERNELARRHPSLLPPQLAALVAVEDALSDALAERLGLDPRVDPYPRLVVVAAVATLRSTMTWWHENGRPGSLAGSLAGAFDALAAGLPAPRRRGRRP